MNEDDKQPIEGAESERPAGQVEGSAAEPTSNEVQEMYDNLGIKATAPTGKSKGRPKADAGGSGKDSAKNDASGKSEKGRGSDDGGDKSKASSASGGDGGNGNASDSKGAKGSEASGKDGGADGKVSKSGEDDADGVQKNESRNNGEASKSGEDDDDEGNGGAGKDGGESGDAEEEGKRPGKSNPEVEKRFQKLTNDVKERDTVITQKDDRIAELEKQIRETQQKQYQEKVAAEDPEYTIDDFRKVRDENGNVLELDQNQAELAWRRWKDGYDQRKVERDAQVNHEAALEEARTESTRKMVESSVASYDTLVDILQNNPELDVRSDKFDQEFSDSVMPIIEDMIIYQPGTEPGNEAQRQPVIVGMRMNPQKMLEVIGKVKAQKRALPLNGTDDNVESRSNVSVPHSRSSDPTVNEANELMKTLGINKRF